MSENAITEFTGENAWLSNLWPVEVELDGVKYPSVENAYHAARRQIDHRAPYVSCPPECVEFIGVQSGARSDWLPQRLYLMRNLLAQKFAPGTLLGTKLMATGHTELVNGNAAGDEYWGECNDVGYNLLGKLLMRQRTFLQEQSLEDLI